MAKIPRYFVDLVRFNDPHRVVKFDGIYLVSLLVNTQYRQLRSNGDYFEFASEASGNQQYVSLPANQNGELDLSFYDVKHKVWWPVDGLNKPLASYSCDELQKWESEGYELEYEHPSAAFKFDFFKLLHEKYGGEWSYKNRVLKQGSIFSLYLSSGAIQTNGFILADCPNSLKYVVNSLFSEVKEAIEKEDQSSLQGIYNAVIRGQMSFKEFKEALK